MTRQHHIFRVCNAAGIHASRLDPPTGRRLGFSILGLANLMTVPTRCTIKFGVSFRIDALSGAYLVCDDISLPYVRVLLSHRRGLRIPVQPAQATIVLICGNTANMIPANETCVFCDTRCKENVFDAFDVLDLCRQGIEILTDACLAAFHSLSKVSWRRLHTSAFGLSVASGTGGPQVEGEKRHTHGHTRAAVRIHRAKSHHQSVRADWTIILKPLREEGGSVGLRRHPHTATFRVEGSIIRFLRLVPGLLRLCRWRRRLGMSRYTVGSVHGLLVRRMPRMSHTHAPSGRPCDCHTVLIIPLQRNSHKGLTARGVRLLIARPQAILQETSHFGVCDTVELPEESREEMLRHSDTSVADYRLAIYTNDSASVASAASRADAAAVVTVAALRLQLYPHQYYCILTTFFNVIVSL